MLGGNYGRKKRSDDYFELYNKLMMWWDDGWCVDPSIVRRGVMCTYDSLQWFFLSRCWYDRYLEVYLTTDCLQR